MHNHPTDEQLEKNDLTTQLANKLDAEVARRLHPLSWVLSIAGGLVQFVFVAGIFLLQSDSEVFSEIFGRFPIAKLIIPIFVFVTLIMPIIHYLSYRFQIVEGEFRIRWGVINKQQRHIPLAKIHNVAIKQTLLQRILGVAEVTLESAGSGQESEAKLSVLAMDEALLLEHAVNVNNLNLQAHSARVAESQPEVSAKANESSSPQPMPTNQGTQTTQETQSAQISPFSTAPYVRQLLSLSDNDIIRYGLISNAGIALGGFLTLLISPERIIRWLWLTFVPDDVLAKLPEDMNITGLDDLLSLSSLLLGEQSLFMQGVMWLIMTIGLLLSVLLVSKVYSVISAFVRLYDFKLIENGKNISVEKGLFTRHKSNIPLSKIQVWRVEQSWLHRVFNRQTLKLDTAVLGNAQGEKQFGRGISELIPIATPEKINQLLTYWQQPFPEEYEFVPVHPMAFRRILFWRVVLIALLTLVGCVLLSKYMLLWLVLAVLALTFSWIASRKRADYMGLVVTDSHILWRDGWLNRVCYIAEIPHAHAIAITHSPFDRRYDMATLIIDTVGGTLLQARITMKYLPYDVAEQVADIVKAKCM